MKSNEWNKGFCIIYAQGTIGVKYDWRLNSSYQFICLFFNQAYCISIVWRCYKFLMLKAQAGRSVLRYMGGVSGPVDQESQTLVMGQDLPDYDTAMADPQYRHGAFS